MKHFQTNKYSPSTHTHTQTKYSNKRKNKTKKQTKNTPVTRCKKITNHKRCNFFNYPTTTQTDKTHTHTQTQTKPQQIYAATKTIEGGGGYGEGGERAGKEWGRGGWGRRWKERIRGQQERHEQSGKQATLPLPALVLTKGADVAVVGHVVRGSPRAIGGDPGPPAVGGGGGGGGGNRSRGEPRLGRG